MAQNISDMKNARKQLGEVALKETTECTTGSIFPDNPDDLILFNNPVFYQKPETREPDSPKTESFRSFLKAALPNPKVPQTLLERIKSMSEGTKD